MKKSIKKILATVGCAFVLVGQIAPSIQTVATLAESALVVDFDKTSLAEEVKLLKDNGVISLAQSMSSKVEVVAATEYCYSDDEAFAEKYYGFYVYVYVPNKYADDVNYSIQENANNTVNMAIVYTDGQPAVYGNVPLEYCSKTLDKNYYKFKVADESLYERTKAQASSNDNAGRRYDIAGVTLVSKSGSLDDSVYYENDIKYEKTYYYAGYAKGCSKSSKNGSTLQCEIETLETLRLQVEHTYGLGDNQVESIHGDSTYKGDKLNTAYFGVPQTYFAEYGGLQKICAEWWEYKTKPVFVTSDQSAYEALKDYIGVNIGEKDTNLDWRILWDEYVATVGGHRVISKIYNNIGAEINQEYIFDNVKYIFENVESEAEINILIFDEGIKNRHTKLNTNDIVKYISDYTHQYELTGGERIKTRYGESYLKSLFAESIDEDRVRLLEESKAKYGKEGNYIQLEIDADEDTQDIAQAKQNFWQKLWGTQSLVEKNVNPIVRLDYSIFSMSVEEFSETYMIAIEEAETVLDNCKEQLNNGLSPVLFRFAVTDYYAGSARFDKIANLGESGYYLSKQDGAVIQETMFFDFDVISLTFRDKQTGEDTVIPVVSNPTNSTVNDSDIPDNSQDELFENSSSDSEEEENKVKIAFNKKNIITWIIATVGIITFGAVIYILYDNYWRYW